MASHRLWCVFGLFSRSTVNDTARAPIYTGPSRHTTYLGSVRLSSGSVRDSALKYAAGQPVSITRKKPHTAIAAVAGTKTSATKSLPPKRAELDHSGVAGYVFPPPSQGSSRAKVLPAPPRSKYGLRRKRTRVGATG